MDFNFDIRGFLKPEGKNECTFEELQLNFVEPFDLESTRYQLLKNLEKYNQELLELLEGHPITQWINGSFVSTKKNPKDIDLVTLLDYSIVETKENKLKKFTREHSLDHYKIDAYIVKLYPLDHPYYNRTKSDLLYWENWFSKTRLNRRKQRFPKGFLELRLK